MNTNVIGVKIILSALWVASMFVWQQGDVQRLYSGDFVPGETQLGEMVSPGTLWMISAITMTIPVVMAILSLTLNHPVNRWANIIMGIVYTGYNLIGLSRYPSAYDRFLIFVGIVFTALIAWYAWRWVQAILPRNESIGVLLPVLGRGDWQGMDQFAFASSHSVVRGLNRFGWTLLGVAPFLMAQVFEGNRLERWIRWWWQIRIQFYD